MDLRIYSLEEEDFAKVIELGEEVHGKNYLTHSGLGKILRRSCSQGRCCSYVLYDRPRNKGGRLVGFRLTYAPGQWEIDEWCTPDEWGVDPEKVCYFKSNTLHPDYRGIGMGLHLLDVSKQTVRQLGGTAGVTHIWLDSPSKGAFRYFTKAGGKTIWIWPNRWTSDLELEGYECVVCCANDEVNPCTCPAAEMILHFGEQDE